MHLNFDFKKDLMRISGLGRVLTVVLSGYCCQVLLTVLKK